MLLERGMFGTPSLAYCHTDPIPDRKGWMDGWMSYRLCTQEKANNSVSQRIILLFN